MGGPAHRYKVRVGVKPTQKGNDHSGCPAALGVLPLSPLVGDDVPSQPVYEMDVTMNEYCGT